jgi:uncharacterized caspase-like protein
MNELHFAVVVGINRYPGIENQLTTAREDAEAFAGWLTAPGEGGLENGHVRLIIADAAEENTFTDYWRARPVRQEVITALAEFHHTVEEVDASSWQNTRLYVYVSGHGVVPPAGRGALLFADSSPPKYFSDHLDLGQYEQLYEQVTPFREVILLADCCREIVEGTPVASAPPFGGPRRGATRRVLAFATAYSRKAAAPLDDNRGDDPNGRGFFTKALLEGLRGKATHDPRTGAIRSDHLEAYLYARVPALAAEYDYEQQAELIHARPGTIELARVRVERFPVELRLPAGWNGQVTVTGVEDKVEVFPVASATGALRFELPNGVYKAALEPGPRSALFEVEGKGEIVDL